MATIKIVTEENYLTFKQKRNIFWLAKKWEIIVFSRMVGNTGISREIL